MDSIARRSRMRRTRTGKRIELTARDLEIFRVMARYRFLSSTSIYAFVGGASETRFKERLGDLFHEGYLDRPERQWDMANCRHRPAIHQLDAGAKRVLDENGIVEVPRTWLSFSAHRQFAHSVMVCELVASIELGVRLRANLRFIPWPEILARAPPEARASTSPFSVPVPLGSYLVPDALFGIEYAGTDKKAYRFFALEADRGTMPVLRSNPNQTSYLRKLAAYRGIIANLVHKTHWGLPNLLVLTVTTNQARMADMIEGLGDRTDTSAAFLFKTIGAADLSALANGLISEPWERAGLPPLQIDN